MVASPQEWDPDQYARNAAHIPARGRSLVAVLDPRPGERILDLGCGPGALASEMIALGASVVGVDASPEMVAAARARGIDARAQGGEHLAFDQEFDGVFSNAALHWMKSDPDAVLLGIFRALRPGGRFVAEFGGLGNVAGPRVALRAMLESRGRDPDSVDPWYFPSVEDYRPRVERAGLSVESIALIPVPTAIPGGMDAWVDTFGVAFLHALPEAERAQARAEVIRKLTPILCDEQGRWVLDHMRLRVVARRPR